MTAHQQELDLGISDPRAESQSCSLEAMEGFKFVDLFAGIGGFHRAMSQLGGECVLAVEIDQACQQVYRTAFPGTPLVGDLRSLTRVEPSPDASERSADELDALIPDHDVLCAGFPCQPFSKSGFQKGVRDQTRGTLFFDIMSIVLAKRPRFVILENVRNLAGPRHRDTWETIVQSLREAGYRVADEPVVMSPHLIAPDLGGAPQVRDRVFILARRVDVGTEDDRTGEPLVRREPTHGWNPKRWRIADCLDPESEIAELPKYVLRPAELGWIEAWQAFIQEIPGDWLPGFPIWVDAFQREAHVPPGTPRWKSEFLIKNAAFFIENEKVIKRWLRGKWGPLKQRVEEFPPSRQRFEWQARSVQPTREQRNLESLVMHFRPSGIRVKPATYLPALVAITQTSVIGPGVAGGSTWRRITPTEAARLQGIDGEVFARAGVPDPAAYKQLGNAVNVGCVRFVASALFLDGSEATLRDAV